MVDQSKITASISDGVLKVVLPKVEKGRSPQSTRLWPASDRFAWGKILWGWILDEFRPPEARSAHA